MTKAAPRIYLVIIFLVFEVWSSKGVDYETGRESDDLKFDLTISGTVVGEGFCF